MGIGAPASSPYGRDSTITSRPTMRTRATNYTASASSTAKRKRTTAGENDARVDPKESAQNAQKRGKNNYGMMPLESSVEVIDLTGDEPEDSAVVKKPRRSPQSKKSSEPVPERRARMFRKHPPNTYLQRLERVRTQRMFVANHTVNWVDGIPIMEFDFIGSTGNVYKVTIGKEPSCDCPDACKGNQCKHICYVLVNALKAPAHLQYQLAFLSTELCEIYQGSPLSRQPTNPDDNTAGNRKPIEDDCPICFMEFEPAKEEIVWCKAACGNNIHKLCFDKWAATQRAQGVRCVFCRSPWQSDNEKINVNQLKTTGQTNHEGYVNVADQMGLPPLRDYSTYHMGWGSRDSSYYGYGQRRYRW